MNTTPMLDSIILFGTKGVVVLLATSLAILLLSRRSAALRHLVWATALAILIMLPFASTVAPGWSATLPFPLTTSSAGSALRSSDLRVESASESVRDAPAATTQGTSNAPIGSIGTAASPRQNIVPNAAPKFLSLPSLPAMLTFVWVVGLFVVLLDILTGNFLAWRMIRRSRQVTEPDVLAAVDELRSTMRISRDVNVGINGAVRSPCTWGLFRPSIVLPEEALLWSDERMRLVLLHELGHVARYDWLTQLVAHTACAVHWFNPLTWFARSRVLSEQEIATDDLVLQQGNQAAEYASNLLEIARESIGRKQKPLFLTPAAIAMSRPSAMEGRLLSILDASRERTRVQSRLVLATAMVATLVVIPLAGFHPAAAANDPLSPEQSDVAARAEYAISVAPAATEVTAAQTGTDVLPESAPIASIDPMSRPATSTTLASGADVREDSAKVMLLLSALMSESDAGVRTQIIRILAELDSRLATDPLSKLLISDESDEVRAMCALALAEIGDPKAIAPLSKALLDDSSAQVRRHAARALAEADAVEAVGVLENAARKDTDKEVRAMGAWALGEMRQDSSVPVLLSLTSDESTDVRAMAIWALGEIRNEAAVDGLVVALRDAEADVRAKAAWALAEIRSPAAANALLSGLSDEDAEVRSHIARALGEIGANEAAEPLLQLLRNDASTEVRKAAAQALSQLDF